MEEDKIDKADYETLVISKLINIENRVTKMESSITWFKYIARGSAIVVFGFFGMDMTGVF